MCILIIESQCTPVLPEGHCARCPIKLPTNDPNAWMAAVFVVNQLGPGHVLMRVETANTEERTESVPTSSGGTSKIVVGQNYYLWLKLLKFNIYYGYQPKHCRATVWVKPDGTKEVTRSSC